MLANYCNCKCIAGRRRQTKGLRKRKGGGKVCWDEGILERRNVGGGGELRVGLTVEERGGVGSVMGLRTIAFSEMVDRSDYILILLSIFVRY